MKNNTALYGLIALIIIIIGAFGYTQGWFNSAMHNPSQAQALSLKGLLASNTTQKCTFNNTAQGSNSSGTVYAGNGFLRVDFESSQAGKSHLIVRDGTSYVWMDNSQQGFSIPFDSMKASTASSSNGSVDPNAVVNYDCKPWTVDQSVFVLPAEVNFQILPGATPQAQSNASQTGAAVSAGATASTNPDTMTPAERYTMQCKACDAVNDPTQKAQCKAAFDCR